MDIQGFESFPEWGSVIKIVVLAASVAYAWTEGVKWCLDHATFDDKIPSWIWTAGTRVLSIVFAILAVYWLLTQDTWGIAIALVAGIFNTALVKFGKTYAAEKFKKEAPALKELVSGDGKKDAPEDVDSPEDDLEDEEPLS